MNGHVRKRSGHWEVVLELGKQPAQRCPACRKRYWGNDGSLEACPRCGGQLEATVARRQIVLPDKYRTKKDADRRLTREKTASMDGVFVEPATLTLGDFLKDHWLPQVKGTVRPTTYEAYKLHVRGRIVPRIGHIPLQKLTTRDVDALYSRLITEKGQRGKVLSPATCHGVHRALHSALEKAVDWNLIPRNPADGAQRPKLTRPEMKTWTREELTTFLSLTESDRLGPLWRTMSMCGIRRGEALALRWSDVDLEACRLTVRRSRVMVGYAVQEQDTKTGRSRVIALDRGTVAALRRQSQQQLDDAGEWGDAYAHSGFVFTRPEGTPWHPDRITKLFDEAVEASGLTRIRLHDLRHTMASLMLQANVHPKVVSERLGHANIGMTLDTYSHLVPALQESAAELVAALVDSHS